MIIIITLSMLYISNQMTFNGYDVIDLNIFYIVTILLAILAILVFSSVNTSIYLLFLLSLFVTIAIYLILTGFYLIGLSYLLVYIGAVSILFLFILMLINVRISELFIDSANSIPVVLLQSSPSTFVMKIGIIYISISYSDDLLSFYQTISDTFHIEKSSFGSRPMHPLIREAYDLYLAMQEKSVNIRPLFDQYISRIDFANFSPLSFTRDQLQFHCNLAIANHIQRMILCLLGSFVLILGVNIIYVIDLIVTVVDGFCNFVKWLVKTASIFFDPVRDCLPVSQKDAKGENSVSKSTNSINSNKATSGSSGSDGDKNGDHNSKKPMDIDSSEAILTLGQLLIVLEYITGQVLNLRQNTIQTRAEIEWYGSPTSHNYPNLRVTLQHVTRYAIAHHNEIVPSLNVTLASILSPDARARMSTNSNSTLRGLLSTIFMGQHLTNALIHHQEVRSLMDREGVTERGIEQGMFTYLLSQLSRRTSS